MARRSTRHNDRRPLLLLGFLGLLALTLFLFSGPRGFMRQMQVAREKRRLETELDSLNQKIVRLEEEKKKLDDPKYVEKLAREEYGMAKKNEKVYRVVPKKSN